MVATGVNSQQKWCLLLTGSYLAASKVCRTHVSSIRQQKMLHLCAKCPKIAVLQQPCGLHAATTHTHTHTHTHVHTHTHTHTRRHSTLQHRLGLRLSVVAFSSSGVAHKMAEVYVMLFIDSTQFITATLSSMH